MKLRYFVYLLLSIVIFGCTPAGLPAELKTSDPISTEQPETDDFFVDRFQKLAARNFRIKGANITQYAAIQTVYSGNDFATIWSNDKASTKNYKMVFDLMSSAWEYGLDPQFYALETLEQLRYEMENGQGKKQMRALTRFEILMTNECLTFMKHLNRGGVSS